MKKFICLLLIASFLITGQDENFSAMAQDIALPAPGKMINLSQAYEPVLIKGLQVHPDNPFKFDFLIDTGNDHHQELKPEVSKLIKYFLAAMTVPEKDLWVNLSPYEKQRMITSNLGETTMGRDMLEEDYILKQLTASLIYPEKNLGKKFWDEVYAKAQAQYGTIQIPVNTFNKVWIVADRADVFEHNNMAYVVGAHLKVMLEEDYLSLSHHQDHQAHSISSQVIRQIILPQIEKEVNEGQNFAALRQIFYCMILASWYKMALKDALLTQIYGNQSKVKVGINQADPKTNEEIFNQYLKAYKKGVFNYIKEETMDPGLPSTFPRKYFSGGCDMAMLSREIYRFTDAASLPQRSLSAVGRLMDADIDMDLAQSPAMVVSQWAGDFEKKIDQDLKIESDIHRQIAVLNTVYREIDLMIDIAEQGTREFDLPNDQELIEIGNELRRIWKTRGLEAELGSLNQYIVNANSHYLPFKKFEESERALGFLNRGNALDRLIGSWTKCAMLILHLRMLRGGHLEESEKGQWRPLDNEILVDEARRFIALFWQWRKNPDSEQLATDAGYKPKDFLDLMDWVYSMIIDPDVHIISSKSISPQENVQYFSFSLEEKMKHVLHHLLGNDQLTGLLVNIPQDPDNPQSAEIPKEDIENDLVRLLENHNKKRGYAGSKFLPSRSVRTVQMTPIVLEIRSKRRGDYRDPVFRIAVADRSFYLGTHYERVFPINKFYTQQPEIQTAFPGLREKIDRNAAMTGSRGDKSSLVSDSFQEIFTKPTEALRFILSNPDDFGKGSFMEKMRSLKKQGQITAKITPFTTKATALDRLKRAVLLEDNVRTLSDFEKFIPRVPPGPLDEGVVLRYLINEHLKPQALSWSDYMQLLDVRDQRYAAVMTKALDDTAIALDHLQESMPDYPIENTNDIRTVVPEPDSGEFDPRKVLHRLLQSGIKPHGLKWIDYVSLLNIAYPYYDSIDHQELENLATSLDQLVDPRGTVNTIEDLDRFIPPAPEQSDRLKVFRYLLRERKKPARMNWINYLSILDLADESYGEVDLQQFSELMDHFGKRVDDEWDVRGYRAELVRLLQQHFQSFRGLQVPGRESVTLYLLDLAYEGQLFGFTPRILVAHLPKLAEMIIEPELNKWLKKNLEMIISEQLRLLLQHGDSIKGNNFLRKVLTLRNLGVINYQPEQFFNRAISLDHVTKALKVGAVSLEDLQRIIPPPPEEKLKADDDVSILHYLLKEGRKPKGVLWQDYIKALDIVYPAYAPILTTRLLQTAAILDHFGESTESTVNADLYIKENKRALIKVLATYLDSLDHGVMPNRNSVTLYFLDLSFENRLPPDTAHGPGEVEMGLTPSEFLRYLPKLAQVILKPGMIAWMKANAAMVNSGGIDLTKYQMHVSKEGPGIAMNFHPVMIAHIKSQGFDGLDFHIESIVPLNQSLSSLFGISSY